jgi:hypothetical protein
MRRGFAFGAGAAAFAVSIAYHGLAVDDSDTPWHVADGKLLLRRLGQGKLGPIRSDPFSWTARGRPWHPNAWGFDGLTGLSFRLGGWTGTSVFRLLLVAGILAAAWVASGRLTASRWSRAIALFVTSCLVAPFDVLRPQLASYLLLLAALHLAAGALDAKRPTGELALLAVVISLWADLHGVVIGGVAAVVALCAGHVLEARQVPALRRALVVSGVALVASCTSPYGWSVWTYGTATRNASRNIQEWQHPSWHSSVDVFLFAFIAVIVGWALCRRRARPWREIVPLLLLTLLALDAVRNEPLAALGALPLLAAATEAGQRRLHRWFTARPGSPTTRLVESFSPYRAAGAVLIAVVAVELFVRHGASGMDLSRLRPGSFPVRSAAALPSGCRLLNEYDQGGYLILARPDIPVSQDGRNDLYGAAFVDEEDRLLAGVEGTAGLDRRGITCVLVGPRRGLVTALATDSRWTMVARDQRAETWIRVANKHQ